MEHYENKKEALKKQIEKVEILEAISFAIGEDQLFNKKGEEIDDADQFWDIKNSLDESVRIMERIEKRI